MTTQTAIEILEAAFVGYPVVDVPRARQFYESVLNLKPSMVYEENGRSWIEYDLKTVTLAINNMSDQWKPSRGPAVGLEVSDFEGTVQSLKAQNVTVVVEPFETPVCWNFVIADPDGNTLIIHKRKQFQNCH